MPTQPARLLFNKYRLEALIGRGAFGEVYRATHIGLNAPRALKVLRKDMPGIGSRDFQECRQRFQLEAALGARLDHPNIVRALDWEQAGDTLILVLEYCPGGTLAERIERQRQDNQPMPLSDVLQIGLQVAQGLAALHALQVVHRDLKPANILFDQQGTAKVADLGLAQVPGDLSMRSQLSRPAAHPGTPGYMSPEQQNQADLLRPASDIYAFGLVLFEMLAGQRYSTDLGDVPLRRLRPDAPAWLEALLKRILSSNPTLRPSNGAEMVELLNTRRAMLPRKKPAKPGSLKWGWGLAGLAAISLCLLFALGGWALSAAPGLKADFPNWLLAPSGSGSTEQMSGVFRLAVASFDVVDPAGSAGQNAAVGVTLAEAAYQILSENYTGQDLDFTPTIWGPDQVGQIAGDSPAERAQKAEQLARRIGADMLVYGQVDASQTPWRFTPEFYLSPEAFAMSEISGANGLGQPFSIQGEGEASRRLDFATKAGPRLQALSKIMLGLLYGSLKDYPNALEQYLAAEIIPGWDDQQGKSIIYLLVGNAYLKLEQLNSAEASLLKSLELDPEYGRAYVSLGSLYYGRAISGYLQTNDLNQIDPALLERSLRTFQRALVATNQPPLANVPARVNLGIGQVYLIRALSASESLSDPAAGFALARAEFEAVLQAYAEGEEPTLRDFAAEAHARLGMIHQLEGDLDLAALEYEQAAGLLYDDPERQSLYAGRATELRQATQSIPTHPTVTP